MPDTTTNPLVLYPWLQRLFAPNSGVNLGLNIGTPVPGTPWQVQAPLNQANPYTTYVSPNTAQPAAAVPVVGATGTQSGPPVHATYDQPSLPPSDVNLNLDVQARRYRAQHGLADSTDALNAESLAAAQSGRTSFDPNLAAAYAQPLAAGVSGPRTDVVNALVMPTTAAQPQQLAANNLLTQGIY